MHPFRLIAIALITTLSLCLAASPNFCHQPRDFNHLTEKNKADIGYIIKALGSKSLVAIGFAKSKLRSAGSRVQAVHPIRYILHVLSDDELTFNLCALHGRGWIWNSYLHGENGDDGFLDSLQQEHDCQGIKPEHIRALAQAIDVEYDHLKQITERENWRGMMQLIMHHAIQKIKYNPYDDV